jgi:rhodanese-related sulfurtransferase
VYSLLDDCNDYNELKEELEFQPCYPRPECTAYDPNTPPPGWPDFVAPWNQRGNISADIRCNLTPPLVNINATTAMFAYETQDIDQNSGSVIFIDVRTPEEVYWVGAPTQVNSITLKNSTVYVPDYFIATLEPSCDDTDNMIHFTVQSQDVWIPASEIASSHLTGVSYNVPVENIDSVTGEESLNPLWGKQADAIIEATGADRIIFFCRSGQRSSVGCYYEFCPFRVLFPGILGMQMVAYEVETQVINGRGGFEGTDYNRALLGYRGFPGRYTDSLSSEPSASFKDAGLPINTGMLPKQATVQPLTGALLDLDELDAPAWANTP